MAASLDATIIVLALGAGALGFPEALHVLVQIAGRSPLTDVAICVFAIAAVTALALGAMLLARFVRKAARAGGDAPLTPPRTDRFAQVTLVVSLGVTICVSACLLATSGAGAGALGLLHLVVADISRKTSNSPVVAALVTGAAVAVLPCTSTLLRVFRRQEDHTHGAAAASGSAGTGRYASMAQAATFTVAVSFLLAVSGGLYTQRGSLVAVAAVTCTMLLAGLVFTRTARNAAGAGGRCAAPTPAANTRRVGSKLTRLAPYLAVVFVSFATIICGLVLTTDAPLESGPDGAKDP